ncbi:hypothetical protein [Streptomyces sp. NPDC097619]|uniref:hypothetical protein n=1 Tax=Streptomyces sp. NPDC097619 TaxID=3157228 RepID=UPI00331C0BE8
MEAEDTVWTWERELPLRYVLVSEEWDGELTVWTRCAGADGLFVDPAPRRERLMLVDCAPVGRLLKAVEGFHAGSGRPVPLGELAVIVDFPVFGADPACDPGGAYGDDHWELPDAVLTAAEPSASDPARYDLVVEAEARGPVWRRTEPADAEWSLFNGAGGGGLGVCHRIEGLYSELRPLVTAPPMRLIGCEPGEYLLRRLVRPRADGDRLRLLAVDRSGQVMRSWNDLALSVLASRPSTEGGTLLDLWLAAGPVARPLPETRPVWEAWYEGPPTETGTWAGLSTEGRREWGAFAAARHEAGRAGTAATSTGSDGPSDDASDDVAAPVRHLDGRHVTDVPGLLCALGEAVAGPGGHDPQCWGVLRGCPCGGVAPATPFTLVWHEAAVARRALAEVTVDTAGERPYVDDVVDFLTGLGITVEFR